MKVNVLNTVYRIKYVPPLSGRREEADFYTKEIRISEQENAPVGYKTDNPKEMQRHVLKHELVHASLFKSNMDQSNAVHETWAVNEEMIDWMAIQMPRIMATCESVINKSVIESRCINEVKSTEVEL